MRTYGFEIFMKFKIIHSCILLFLDHPPVTKWTWERLPVPFVRLVFVKRDILYTDRKAIYIIRNVGYKPYGPWQVKIKGISEFGPLFSFVKRAHSMTIYYVSRTTGRSRRSASVLQSVRRKRRNDATHSSGSYNMCVYNNIIIIIMVCIIGTWVGTSARRLHSKRS